VNTYFVEVNQPENYPIVEIRIYTSDPKNSFAGSIGARAVIDFETQELKFMVSPSVDFSRMTSDKAEDVADWWRLAATTTRQLKSYIKTANDFKRKFTARVVGGSMVIDEVQP